MRPAHDRRWARVSTAKQGSESNQIVLADLSAKHHWGTSPLPSLTSVQCSTRSPLPPLTDHATKHAELYIYCPGTVDHGTYTVQALPAIDVHVDVRLKPLKNIVFSMVFPWEPNKKHCVSMVCPLKKHNKHHCFLNVFQWSGNKTHQKIMCFNGFDL